MSINILLRCLVVTYITPSHQPNNHFFLSSFLLCMKMYQSLRYKFILLVSLLIVSTFSGVSATFSCKDTPHPQACESLATSSKDGSSSDNLEATFNQSLKFTVDQARSIRSQFIQDQNSNTLGPKNDCIELLDQSLNQLTRIQDDGSGTLSPEDIETWLSAGITHENTCLETLDIYQSSKGEETIDAELQNNIERISNSLAMYKSIVNEQKRSLKGSGTRRLLSDDFPTWVSDSERKLLEASVEDIVPSAVVAMDGTGTHKSIAEAIAYVSEASSGRTVIHVKAGTYNENNLNVPVTQSNVLLVRDGKGKTVITGNKNMVDGSTTFRSASFGVSGEGFMARDITFDNTAGPAKHQAVALRVTSDKSVFYRCSMLGYQDTLYTLSNRQFYRDCDIYGTVDYIFGNGAVVLQNCNIFSRKPLSNQKNFITAQGRTDRNQNTGISIQKCRIVATPELQSAKNPTYLGRPWLQYSRTVVMQSYIDGSINPAGWAPWIGSAYLDTLYYGEYMNTGSGASTSGRVKWPGYHPSLSSAEAASFTVNTLISGNSWLPSTGVPYQSGL